MNPWDLLEIAPTVEVRKIKLAYAAMLKKNNPDDDPIAFQKLRQAYEICLAESRRIVQESPAPEQAAKVSSDKTMDPDTDIVIRERDPGGDGLQDAESLAQIIVDDILKLYSDFARRMDPANWTDIFRREEMQQLDVRAALNTRLFALIAEHPNLTGEVYQLLDKIFNWSDQQIDFSKKFPEEMVDFVFWKLHQAPYKHDYRGLQLDREIDFDQYTSLREEGERMLAHNHLEESGQTLEQALKIFSEDPVLFFLLGQLAEKCMDDSSAVTHYSKMIALAPERVEGYLHRGYCFLKHKKITHALNDFRQYLKMDPDHLAATKGMARCYEEMEDYEAAKVLFDLCLEKEPGDFESIAALENINAKQIQIYLNAKEKDLHLVKKLARCYMAALQWEEAVALLKDHPDADAEAYLLCGQAIEYTQVTFEVMDKFYQKAMDAARRTNENGYEILISRGKLLYRCGEEKDAELLFKKAWEINPHNADIADLIALSIFYAGDGRNQDALMWVDRAIAMEPERLPFRQSRGTILYWDAQYSKAIRELDRYVNKIYPARYESWMKGMSHYRLGQYDKAVEALEKTLGDIDLKESSVPFCMAVCYCKMDRLDDACRHANNYQVERWEKYYLQGFLEYTLGHMEKAIQHFETAALKCRTGAAHKALLFCHLQQKDLDKAQTTLETLISSDAEDTEALFQKAAICCLTEQWQLCLEATDRFIQICTRKMKPIDSDIYYYRALSFYGSNRLERAVQEGKMACAENGSKVHATVLTSMLCYELGDIDAAIEIITQHTGKDQGQDLGPLLDDLRQVKASAVEVTPDMDYEAHFPDLKKVPIQPMELACIEDIQR